MRIGRRAQLATVLVGILGGLACGPRSNQVEREVAPVESTTVVLISIDTLRADHLGAYGRPNAGTPTIDSLAHGGTTFRRAQTTAPLTLPAHTSMLTGRSLAGHGVFNNLTFALPEVVPTLAERLRSAGYATGAFVSAPVLARRYGLDRGFDVYDDRIVPTAGSRMAPSHAERSGAETVRVASQFLSDAGTHAAFVFVHLYEPHRPYSPPPDIAERVGGDRYQGEIALADSAVAALVETLKRTGRERNTLLILTADHGEGLGEHGEATHGMYLYAGTLNVPLIVHAPQLGVKARFSDETVSVADIAPTVLDLLKLAPLSDADGLSLAKLVRGEVDTLTRAGVVAESHIPRLEFGWSGLRAWVKRDTKLIQAPRPELYAIVSDPQELHDLASEQRAVVKQQLDQLESAVEAAAGHSPSGAEQSVSAEQQELLRSLGYVASGGKSGPGDLVDPKLVDPKDRAKFAALFDEAVLATQAGQLPEAMDAFSKLRAIEADNPALLFELGQAQIRSGQLQQAKETYQRLVKIRPDQGVAWFRYAQLLDNSHDWEPAEAAYRRAVQVDPNNMDARKALSSLLSEQKRFGEAISELEQASKLDPNDVAIRRDLERLWQASRKR